METPLPPPQPDFVRHGLHPFDQYIDWNSRRGIIQIRSTKLLAEFIWTKTYMEDIHQRVINTVNRRYKDYGDVARTTHTQLSAVIKRYLPIIEAKFNEWYPYPAQDALPVTHMEVTGPDPQTGEDRTDSLELCYCPMTSQQVEAVKQQETAEREHQRLTVWKDAVEQAEQIEVRCKELVDKRNEENQQGNIEFVKKIGGKGFQKRAG